MIVAKVVQAVVTRYAVFEWRVDVRRAALGSGR